MERPTIQNLCKEGAGETRVSRLPAGSGFEGLQRVCGLIYLPSMDSTCSGPSTHCYWEAIASHLQGVSKIEVWSISIVQPLSPH